MSEAPETKPVDPLRAKAQALVDAVSFDNNGVMVGTVFMGGNGGLYSPETLKAADEVRKELLRTEGEQ